jgi:hypothetical protein
MAAAVGLVIQGTTPVELPIDEATEVLDATASSKLKASGPNTPRVLVRRALSSARLFL